MGAQGESSSNNWAHTLSSTADCKPHRRTAVMAQGLPSFGNTRLAGRQLRRFRLRFAVAIAAGVGCWLGCRGACIAFVLAASPVRERIATRIASQGLEEAVQ